MNACEITLIVMSLMMDRSEDMDEWRRDRTMSGNARLDIVATIQSIHSLIHITQSTTHIFTALCG